MSKDLYQTKKWVNHHFFVWPRLILNYAQVRSSILRSMQYLSMLSKQAWAMIHEKIETRSTRFNGHNSWITAPGIACVYYAAARRLRRSLCDLTSEYQLGLRRRRLRRIFNFYPRISASELLRGIRRRLFTPDFRAWRILRRFTPENRLSLRRCRWRFLILYLWWLLCWSGGP